MAMSDPEKTRPYLSDGSELPAAIGTLPPHIGRYQVEKVLGKGGFGVVYLAHDGQLQRLVAVKVPHRHRVSTAKDAEIYLTEARMVAGLDHPHIVPVYDVGSSDECPCFIVSKYIAGSTLARQIKDDRPTLGAAAELVATIAEALHYAHHKGLVHRDIKPGNILIDSGGQPFVVDFGLALREENIGRGSKHAGTPAYMSPEQARGEGHRVDGRSDIFSLGVVLYELLTGRRPFQADTQVELLEQVTRHEPRPLRQVDENIPRELERICFKALAKRASERYLTANDLADDLRHFLAQPPCPTTKSLASPAVAPAVQPPSTLAAAGTITPQMPASDSQPIKIVPKGLRSFDAHDADFFLELLPGARDRDGLPESLRFWKNRIEETDAEKTFSVGLICGPSGCGKSSLVKAGLLPRLSRDVIAAYVEATGAETETRLLSGLRKQCATLPVNLGLQETLAALRRGQGMLVGKKVLIVLDQFEQWLHANQAAENTDLVQALRQCEGSRVQCLVMVRDDFWMAAIRFMRELEIRLVEGQNSAAVDLFPIRHAEKVLAAFGRAFGALPENSSDESREQRQFLDQAVAGLAQEGKVISVRLALFAEMMKGKAWTPTTLKAVGGAEGVGVTFLEETFSASTAPPEHRYHQKAARAVLKTLLPESGTDIKGHMRSYAELLSASGYAGRPQEFADLIRILDSEIRLITPTDPAGKEATEESEPISQAQVGEKYFQLTHDYLVPSLRDWLTRKQKETRRGRAELLLADRAAVWNARPENRQLPSLRQWCQIKWLTAKKNWSEPQRKMMRRAGRVIGLYTGLVALGSLLIVLAGLFIAGQVEARQNANYAKVLVESLSAANTPDVENLVDEIGKYQEWAIPLLREIVASKDSNPKEKLHASLVLVNDDPSQVDFLFQRLLSADVADVRVIVNSLKPHGSQFKQRIRDALANGGFGERLRAAAALAVFDAKDEQWQLAREDVVTALISVPPSELGMWIKVLRPVGSLLSDPLKERSSGRFYGRSVAGDAEQLVVAAALADYLRADPQSLTELVLLADNEREFKPLLEAIRGHQHTVAGELKSLLRQTPTTEGIGREGFDQARNLFWRKLANAAVCLLELGETESVWPLFQQSPDPSLRSYVIDRIARLGGKHEAVAARIKQEPDPASRYALVLALGQFDVGKFSRQQRQSYLEKLAALYRDDPEPGVHAASGWVLRNWQSEHVKSQSDGELENSPPQAGRNWFVNSQGQTFAIVNGPVELVLTEKREPPEAKTVVLSHRFAVAINNVKLTQFWVRFKGKIEDSLQLRHTDFPAYGASWYDAVAYCNWLSEQEMIPEDQWCYEPNDKHEYAEGMKIHADCLQRTGYRLPTEMEWEFVSRANITTDFVFGDTVDLIDKYVLNLADQLTSMSNLEAVDNRMRRANMTMPNSFGVFDIHGPLSLWFHGLNQSVPNGQSDLTVKDALVHVSRGGAFRPPSSNRYEFPPAIQDAHIGFRVARTLNSSDATPLVELKPQNDTRKKWSHSAGSFGWVKESEWIESVDGQKPLVFTQVEETNDYIELYDASRNLTVRLGRTSAALRVGKSGNFNRLYKGSWDQ